MSRRTSRRGQLLPSSSETIVGSPFRLKKRTNLLPRLPRLPRAISSTDDLSSTSCAIRDRLDLPFQSRQARSSSDPNGSLVVGNQPAEGAAGIRRRPGSSFRSGAGSPAHGRGSPTHDHTRCTSHSARKGSVPYVLPRPDWRACRRSPRSVAHQSRSVASALIQRVPIRRRPTNDLRNPQRTPVVRGRHEGPPVFHWYRAFLLSPTRR